MNSIAIEGGCLCGAVRYTIRCAPSVVVNCHCSDCRKATGAPFVTWAIVPRQALIWTRSQPKRVLWAERVRWFCPDCGTSLGVLPGEHADIVAVSVGTMDRPSGVTPSCDAWTQDHLPWVRLLDGLPHYTAGVDAPEPEPATS